MPYFQPKIRRYGGPIDFDSQPLTWIGRHRSFASKDWIKSQIKYGEWIKDAKKRHHYLIYATNFEGTKPLTILIKIRLFETHVLVYHAHILRSK
jgi:hypothetical protein